MPLHHIPFRRLAILTFALFRPHTLTASFSPVLVGTALAFRLGFFDASLFIALLIVCLLIQGATNMFNEYFDHARGLDSVNSAGISGVLVRSEVPAHCVWYLAWLCLALALIPGLYLCAQTSWLLLPLGFVCVGAGYFYSGGPFPVSATPFGEAVAGFFMGFVIVNLASFIQTKELTNEALLLSLSPTLLISGILLANNIRDLVADAAYGRKTLAIRLGKNKALVLLSSLFVLAFFPVLFFQIQNPAWVGAFLSFLSAPLAVHAIKSLQIKGSESQLNKGLVKTAQMNTAFNVLLALGLLF